MRIARLESGVVPAGGGRPTVGALRAAVTDEPIQVIALLRSRPHRAGELAEAVGLSPAAMTRHLRALKQGGLVEDARPDFDARVRVFSLKPEPMAALKQWLGETERLWRAPGERLAFSWR